MRKVMLDTNVVIDYLMGRAPGCDDCAKLISMYRAGKHAIYVSTLSLKDAYYLVSMQLKRMERKASGVLGEDMAQAANQVAWSCIRQLTENMLVLPTGRAETLQAFVLHSAHADLEDHLIVATALSAGIDDLVSNDDDLIRHAPIACLSSADAVSLLEAETAGL